MPDPAPTGADALRVTLHFELSLHEDGPFPRWQAELGGAGPVPRLRFQSMGEFIRYLARLDLQVPPPRGIR